MSPRELGTGSPTRSSFPPTPMISCCASSPPRRAPTRAATGAHQRRRIPQRATPVRALGRGGLATLGTVAAEPFDGFSERFLSRRKRRARFHPGQPGLVRQRPHFRRESRSLPRSAGRTGRGCHRRLSCLLGARTALRRSRGANRLLPRRRLQICDGGRGLRLPACAPGFWPAAADHRLVRRVRGLEPAARSVGYAQDARRFLGATFDPSGLYRFTAVQRMLRRTD